MNWLLEGLEQIAKGLPTHTAAKLAKDLLAKLETRYNPVMDAPPMTPHAIDLPEPWEPVAILITGQRAYRCHDGRYACGIRRERYWEILGTRRAEAVAQLVHAHAHLYIEASDEADLIEKVAAFDRAWQDIKPQNNGDDDVHCTAHVDYEPESRISPRSRKRIMRTRNARTTQDP